MDIYWFCDTKVPILTVYW